MKIIVFLNQLGIGGTEKAAARWARGLAQRGHALHVLTLEDGPRRNEFEDCGIEVRAVPAEASKLRDHLRSLHPEVIHAHAPGHPHRGDILGEALLGLSKIPVVQTNVFGQLENQKEDAWTDFRLFVSWTSSVQAARRYFRPLDPKFFRRISVAVNPVDPLDPPSESEIEHFRAGHGVRRDEVLFGRISRPEPNKWTDLLLHAFREALRKNPKIKLLLREPPIAVSRAIAQAADRGRFVVLPATTDAAELRLTIASLDAVLHTSVIGESFGYGIAESLNLGKAAIANSTPWGDQAQLELILHRRTGLIASTAKSIARAILALSDNPALREHFGKAGQRHIRNIADPSESIRRLECALQTAIAGEENSHAGEDLLRAQAAADNLDAEQFGHTLSEQFALRPFYYRVRFYQWRRKLGLPTRKR